jgi:hypothetical protein
MHLAALTFCFCSAYKILLAAFGWLVDQARCLQDTYVIHPNVKIWVAVGLPVSENITSWYKIDLYESVSQIVERKIPGMLIQFVRDRVSHFFVMMVPRLWKNFV